MSNFRCEIFTSTEYLSSRRSVDNVRLIRGASYSRRVNERVITSHENFPSHLKCVYPAFRSRHYPIKRSTSLVRAPFLAVYDQLKSERPSRHPEKARIVNRVIVARPINGSRGRSAILKRNNRNSL